MKTEEMLRLQAYLDNEVSSSEARQIASWIARDADAKALYEELACTKSLLAPENEPAVACPDSREFYWSKIAREIERAEREPVRQQAPKPWWLRVFVPIAGAAALALVVFTSISSDPAGHMAQAEQSETDSSITYYSREQKMTVVWIPSGRVEADASIQQQDEEEMPSDQPAQQDEAL